MAKDKVLLNDLIDQGLTEALNEAVALIQKLRSELSTTFSAEQYSELEKRCLTYKKELDTLIISHDLKECSEQLARKELQTSYETSAELIRVFRDTVLSGLLDAVKLINDEANFTATLDFPHECDIVKTGLTINDVSEIKNNLRSCFGSFAKFIEQQMKIKYEKLEQKYSNDYTVLNNQHQDLLKSYKDAVAEIDKLKKSNECLKIQADTLANEKKQLIGLFNKTSDIYNSVYQTSRNFESISELLTSLDDIKANISHAAETSKNLTEALSEIKQLKEELSSSKVENDILLNQLQSKKTELSEKVNMLNKMRSAFAELVKPLKNETCLASKELEARINSVEKLTLPLSYSLIRNPSSMRGDDSGVLERFISKVSTMFGTKRVSCSTPTYRYSIKRTRISSLSDSEPGSMKDADSVNNMTTATSAPDQVPVSPKVTVDVNKEEFNQIPMKLIEPVIESPKKIPAESRSVRRNKKQSQSKSQTVDN